MRGTCFKLPEVEVYAKASLCFASFAFNFAMKKGKCFFFHGVMFFFLMSLVSAYQYFYGGICYQFFIMHFYQVRSGRNSPNPGKSM